MKNRFKTKAKTKMTIFLALVVLLGVSGCYRRAPQEAMVRGGVRVVALDASAPSADEADILVMTHVKKPSTALAPRSADAPYAFTIRVDGASFVETVKGSAGSGGHNLAERGSGVTYELRKRLRVRPGEYTIDLEAEDGPKASVTRKLEGGGVYVLRFVPVYGPKRFMRPKHFDKGVVDFTVEVTRREENG